tara:strand:- start:112 stop:600 length:489 start_codon:yes stop_codon:yes gene_type:complete
MRPVLTLIGFLTLAVVACGPAATPAPTADVPTFADGEAIAVVKTWLAGVTWETTGVIRTGSGLVSRPRIASQPCITYLLGCEDVAGVAVVQHNCWTEYYGRGYVWQDSYLGNGAWSVTASDSDGPPHSEWRVFERTLPVIPIESAYARIGCLMRSEVDSSPA